MNRKKLKKIRREIATARRRSNKNSDLVAIATMLGRKRAKGEQATGKEPTYLNIYFPDARPISIPNHGSKDFKPGTAHNILNQFEEDVFRWEEWLQEQNTDDAGEEREDEYENRSRYTN